MSHANPRCLIVVTALRYSDDYGAAAIASARAHGEAVVLCLVLDPDVPGAVVEQLAEGGFLGERLMHEFQDTMREEHRERGLGYLEALEREVKAAGLSVETRVAEGPFVQTICREAAASSARRVLAAQMTRSPLSRVLFGSKTDRLRREAPCPVEMFDLSGAPATRRAAPSS